MRLRIYIVKENHIGSAVSEIPRYRQTARHRSCFFIIRTYTKHFIIFMAELFMGITLKYLEVSILQKLMVMLDPLSREFLIFFMS